MKFPNIFDRSTGKDNIAKLPDRDFTLAEIAQKENKKNNRLKAWLSLGLLSTTIITTLNYKKLFGTDTEKFISMLENQAGGKVLLQDIDPTRNSSRSQFELDEVAKEFYRAQDSCEAPLEILTRSRLKVDIKDLRSDLGESENETALVKKDYPVTRIESMKDFSKSLQILRIQCRTVVPYTSPRLRKISLDGKLTDTLIAEPSKKNADLERVGVEPGGFYSPILDQIDIDIANSAEQKEVFPHENVHFGVTNTGVQSFENARKILGEEIYKKWEAEGYPDNEDSVPGKSISTELEKMLRSQGFTPYSLYMYNSPVLKEITKYKKNIEDQEKNKAELVLKKSKLTSDKKDKITLAYIEQQIKDIEKNIFDSQKYINGLIPKLPPLPEVFSTGIEAVYNDKLSDPKIQAMSDRHLDIINKGYNSKIYSKEHRRKWTTMVAEVQGKIKNGDLLGANKTISDFDQKYPDLIK